MVIHEASENYLEAILMLREKQTEVRSVDICNFFGFAKSTVSVAMKKLRENGLIEIDEGGHIELTEDGQKIAKKIYERHVVIAKLFMQLGVSEKTALEDACKVEHDLSEETFAALKQHYLKHQVEV
ncbi:metal-dependent transcriptional regulator [Clostridiales bacterium COT073_COT-073]|nr:metal-dependent transcriptional regulator [Clostridiales bacterium COT073_COT-073]